MVTIRLATEEDSASMLDIYAPYITDTPVTFEESVPSSPEFTGRIRDTVHKLPWLVCESNGVIAGYAYAGDHRTRPCYRWTKEVSVYIHPDYRRAGIARGLYTSLCGLLKLQGVANVLAGITLPNETSVAFHEDFGFKKVGVYKAVGFKLGKWHDVGWWEFRLNGASEKPINTIKNMEAILQTRNMDESFVLGVKSIKT